MGEENTLLWERTHILGSITALMSTLAEEDTLLLEQTHVPFSLLTIKRAVNTKCGTNITTQKIAQWAQLSTTDVFTIEVGGYSSEENVRKVVAAFNHLSGMNIRPEDIRCRSLDKRGEKTVSPSL